MISGIGVPETSGYPALSKLLNAVGDNLKPKITAIIHPSNNGAGIPDGGLFSSKELKKYGTDSPVLFTLKPERGVIEVKPLDKDLSSFESSPQVRGYLEFYARFCSPTTVPSPSGPGRQVKPLLVSVTLSRPTKRISGTRSLSSAAIPSTLKTSACGSFFAAPCSAMHALPPRRTSPLSLPVTQGKPAPVSRAPPWAPWHP